MRLANEEIRKAAREQDVFLWQIAERYGLNDSNFSRLLRRELPRGKKDQILKIIQELKGAD